MVERVPKGKSLTDAQTNHPYLRVVDMVDGTISRKDLKYITDDVFVEISRYTISSDNIYISIAGTIGRVGTIPQDLNGASLTENAAKLVFETTETSPEYLAAVMSTDDVQSQISKLTMGVGVPKLALNRIESIKIPASSWQ
jgi:restriction endonuclease S subunit